MLDKYISIFLHELFAGPNLQFAQQVTHVKLCGPFADAEHRADSSVGQGFRQQVHDLLFAK